MRKEQYLLVRQKLDFPLFMNGYGGCKKFNLRTFPVSKVVTSCAPISSCIAASRRAVSPHCIVLSGWVLKLSCGRWKLKRPVAHWTCKMLEYLNPEEVVLSNWQFSETTFSLISLRLLFYENVLRIFCRGAYIEARVKLRNLSVKHRSKYLLLQWYSRMIPFAKESSSNCLRAYLSNIHSMTA